MTNIPTGRFVWFEYVSTNAAKAQGFYGEVFGWGTRDVPMPGQPYTMIAVHGDTIGGYRPTPEGAPAGAHWLPHLQVANAAETAAKAKSLGGSIAMAAAKLGDVGTMAVVKDPHGAVFALWQSTKPEGTGDFRNKPSTWSWNELVAKDVDASVRFYTELAGFTDKPMDMGPMGTYHVLAADGKDRAGIMAAPSKDIPQSWLPYVQVENAKTTCDRATKLGATVMMPPSHVPNVGTIAVFVDPMGAATGILQPDA